ncbi:hypothetical protein [uncultured Pontibacter sp.]|uniref:hypothetical protein n=1 Tax=uncultured Pontibacter sp. TaxID=453356 RepID=UPI00261077DD|nr:hypothetical protein [uncultured Pontibacter sp.]
MNRIKPLLLAFLFMVPFLFACESGTDVVESGTYQGTVDKVVPEKREIYVKTDDNKRLELYFTDNTSLTRNGQTVEFDQLKEGGKVEVQVEKTGQRLDPVAVTILE